MAARHYQFTPAISFSIDCEDQAEVDRLWNQLLDRRNAPDVWLDHGSLWRVLADHPA